MNPTEPKVGTDQPSSVIQQSKPQAAADHLQLQMQLQQLRDNQNLGMGVVGGVLGALVGSVLWALVTYATDWQIGFMAIGVGFLVGWGVSKLGQGVDKSFGYVGAVLSLLGCLFGNYLTACVHIASFGDAGIFEVLGGISWDGFIYIMIETFHPMDVLFYSLAVYYGYKYSFRGVAAARPVPGPKR